VQGDSVSDSDATTEHRLPLEHPAVCQAGPWLER
jgi:hypothetical protein